MSPFVVVRSGFTKGYLFRGHIKAVTRTTNQTRAPTIHGFNMSQVVLHLLSIKA